MIGGGGTVGRGLNTQKKLFQKIKKNNYACK
jgi:hypothetical protein